MTYGEGPAGYDVRLDLGTNIDGSSRTEHSLWPGEFMLSATVEKFLMPKNVLGIVHDKSTWARQGIACQNTVIEPGWRGYLTLEITNHGRIPIKFESGMPIAQVVFHFVDQMTDGYEGKYQDQEAGPQSARHDA